MERNRQYYDKAAAGRRIREQRKRLGISRSDMAKHIGRAEKYYADIERGYCGMSVETMICIAGVLGLTLDYITFGEDEKEVPKEAKRILFYLGNCSEKRRKKAVELLQVYFSE